MKLFFIGLSNLSLTLYHSLHIQSHTCILFVCVNSVNFGLLTFYWYQYTTLKRAIIPNICLLSKYCNDLSINRLTQHS